MKPSIYFATDHSGFTLKNTLLEFVRDELGYEVTDCGALTLDETDDYPDYVNIAARKVSEDLTNTRAIVLGASGQGEAIVANKHRGVRAAVYYGAPSHAQVDAAGEELSMIASTRVHNDANVLSLGARFLGDEEAKKVVQEWLETDFRNEERHVRRIKKIESQKGFTLLELLITFGIIAILIAIVSVALDVSREGSRNAARISQLDQYRKAFELYYSETGSYPTFGSGQSAVMCLGDYADNRCWINGSSVSERAALEAAIVPTYLPRMPKGEKDLFGQGGSNTFEGMTYRHQNYGAAYTIQYFMEGNGRPCELQGATGSDTGDDTLCTFNFPNN